MRVEIALPTLAKAQGNFGLEVTRSMVNIFVSVCHALLDWERNELAPGADEKTQQQHRAALKRLLRLARALHAEASDPDYPDPTAAAEMQAIIWKLNESWQTFYNAMPETEAEQLLRECFPGHGS